MRIVHLTSVHPRYDTRIFLKECTSLANNGHEVYLIVADGKGDECRDGVSIIDVGKPVGRLGRMWATVNAVYRKAVELGADVFHLHDPELLRIALKLRNNGGARVVFDAHEEYVRQIALKKYLPAWFRILAAWLFGVFEKFVISRIDCVVVVIDEQVIYYKPFAKYISLVPNYPIIKSKFIPEKIFDYAHLFHGGSLTEERGLYQMIALAKELHEIGDLTLAGSLNVLNVNFEAAKYVGTLDKNALMEAYASANIGIILYHPVGQYGKASAVKLYEYMASGIPVIVPDHGEWPSVIKKIDCGVAVNVFDVNEQLNAVKFILSDPARSREMGKNGFSYVVNHASWDVAFGSMNNMYDYLRDNND